jgi:CIC family chloride channel protein
MNWIVLVKFVGFIEWLKHKLTKKQFIFVSAVLVGLSVGLAAVILKSFVHFFYAITSQSRTNLTEFAFALFPLLGIILTTIIVHFTLNGKLEKGIPSIYYAIANKLSSIPFEQMYAQIITSSVTVGLGGSAGLEAPIVVTGAAFGSNYSKTYKLNYKDKTLLLACGVAAGISAAFNAPIAGVLFALEVLLIDISISAFTPLIIASATGALVPKIILNDGIILSFSITQNFNYNNVPWYILLGISAGFVSVYHARTFMLTENLIKKKFKNKISKAIFGGVILSIIIWLFPSLYGEGYASIKALTLHQEATLFNNSFLQRFASNHLLVLGFLGILVFIKSIVTSITLSSGGNGGNFAPSLFVGSYLGYCISSVINLFHWKQLPVANFTIVGMAGILSGIYHSPLTAIFLIAEITGGYTLMIPLMIVASVSYAISRYFEPYSMDTKQLGMKGKIFSQYKDHNILTTLKTSNLIENDFLFVGINESFGDIVKTVAKSKRNIFPVIDENENLCGIIILDDIREIMFDQTLYNKLYAHDIMTPAPALLNPNHNMELVMRKFDETEAWNLPVVENGKYLGFISKSSVFSNYRNKLKQTTID